MDCVSFEYFHRKMHPAQVENREYPFTGMKIDDSSFLETGESRFICRRCFKSRKYFCYNCNLALEELADRIPKVKLPIKVDIIKHKREIEGKSTSVHAAILSDDVRVYLHPDIPDYSQESGVFLVYPSSTSISIMHLLQGQTELKLKENFGLSKDKCMGTLLSKKLDEVIADDGKTEEMELKEYKSVEELPVKKIVFIDSTWNQSRSIYTDERVKRLKTIVIQTRLSNFWRHQRGTPRWYLATIEAIHQVLLELHVYAFGLDPNYRGLDKLEVTLANPPMRNPKEDTDSAVQPYNGQYDNLLFFFQHMYQLIHSYYDVSELKAYKRPTE
ncbi:tRNA-uridine aminocarboxypropyltransferase 1 [Culicoides brevitarsis]|uniref:tRNA-uridine aminocarboxypropyltransferase 1 n=1 Tax=Culicoides brevitarsis TaxID=469753 RepID=UPI00307C7D46